MPATNMSLPNNFANFSLNNMGGGQQYPPQQQYPPNQQGQMDNSNMGMGMQMQGGMRMNWRDKYILKFLSFFKYILMIFGVKFYSISIS